MPSARTQAIRNGKGSSAWRRRLQAEKRRCLADLLAGKPWHCECGAVLDPRERTYTPMAVEGDHPLPLHDGGTNRQRPVLMHRICNNSKGSADTVIIEDAS